MNSMAESYTPTMLKNTWYVACTSDEVAEKPLARKVCNQNLVFYRDSSGTVHALEDYCPHRGAPLSLGTVEGDTLVCGYHGLAMGSDGKTVSMPKQRVERFPCITRYPAVERKGFIWVWPGDPELADEATVPRFEWSENDGWGYGGGLYHIACDYRLMIDNLMDLTHETYVHSTSIGQKEIDEEPVTTTVDGDKVVVQRFMDDVMAPPFWQMAMTENGLDPNARVDRWQICRFSPPSHVMIEVGVALQGHGGYDAPDEVKAHTTVVDFITPETDTSIHYFWGMARTFRPDDTELTDKIRIGQGEIFAEDQEMLESQQRNLLQYPERNLMKLDIDAGGVHSRRILAKLIETEQAGS